MSLQMLENLSSRHKSSQVEEGKVSSQMASKVEST